jgi:hypothetical protein
VFLPAEIDGAFPSETPAEQVDIESLDFFSGRRFLSALMEREGDSCFYCMRFVRLDTCAVDHVVPQLSHLDRFYRNVVVACHDCNSKKAGADARDLVRSLMYRSSESDFAAFTRFDQLQAGSWLTSHLPWSPIR